MNTLLSLSMKIALPNYPLFLCIFRFVLTYSFWRYYFAISSSAFKFLIADKPDPRKDNESGTYPFFLIIFCVDLQSFTILSID